MSETNATQWKLFRNCIFNRFYMQQWIIKTLHEHEHVYCMTFQLNYLLLALV